MSVPASEVLTVIAAVGLGSMTLFLAFWLGIGAFVALRDKRLQKLSAKWRPK